MQTTFKEGLNVGFHGKIKTPGMPAYVENGGIRTVGGIIATENAEKAVFGRALFAVSGTPSKFFVGNAAVTIGGASKTPDLFRGILLNRPMVNEQFPGHSDYVFNDTPADAIYQGAVWVEVDGTPAVGVNVYAASDGTLTTVAGSGDTAAVDINAKIVEEDKATGLYLIYLGGN